MRHAILAFTLSLTMGIACAAPTQPPATHSVTRANQPRASASVGFMAWSGPATGTTPPLTGGIWYPTADTGPATRLFDTPIFHGDLVQPDAALQPGQWPVVLISHGIGGHWQSLAWLGAGLARKGAVVVGVNHPGSTFGDYDMRRSLNHGSRVHDLSTTLDALLADPHLGAQLDARRVYVAGFSLGGWTALSMGGLRGDLTAYTRYCAQSGHRHCQDIVRTGIDLHRLDAAVWNRSYRDTRIQAVAAIDPALHQGLTAVHASDMVSRVLLIGLGDGANRLPDTDFTTPSATLTRILPQAHTEVMAPAFHFSALRLCKPAGPALLAEDNDDPVCTDPPGTDRQALHKRIIRSISHHFGLLP